MTLVFSYVSRMSEKYTPPVAANDNEVLASNVENLKDWRELKAIAPEQQETVLAEGIPNFEQLDADKQIEHLQKLIDSLGGNNENRFVAPLLAKKLGILIETKEFTEKLRQLQAA